MKLHWCPYHTQSLAESKTGEMWHWHKHDSGSSRLAIPAVVQLYSPQWEMRAAHSHAATVHALCWTGLLHQVVQGLASPLLLYCYHGLSWELWNGKWVENTAAPIAEVYLKPSTGIDLLLPLLYILNSPHSSPIIGGSLGGLHGCVTRIFILLRFWTKRVQVEHMGSICSTEVSHRCQNTYSSSHLFVPRSKDSKVPWKHRIL